MFWKYNRMKGRVLGWHSLKECRISFPQQPRNERCVSVYEMKKFEIEFQLLALIGIEMLSLLSRIFTLISTALDSNYNRIKY